MYVRVTCVLISKFCPKMFTSDPRTYKQRYIHTIHERLSGKFLFASLVCNFRHGREEDEVMGVSFSKELVVDRVKVFPSTAEKATDMDKLQARLP